MTKSKRINIIAWLGMALAVTAVLLCVVFYDKLTALGSGGVTQSYETALFDSTTLLEVNIIMDADQWQDLLDNAIDESYYSCDVEVNGQLFKNVGIRAKGNTSLSQVASDSTTDRYSFKLEFDHYVDGQTCYGLDKLVLNNNMSDASSMKEYLTYDMYAFLDLPASLYSYAEIQVNGEEWGLYLALEAVEESFALRNYGTSYGELYKPDSLGVGGAGQMKNFDSDQLNELFEQFGINGNTNDSETETADTTSEDTQTPTDGQFPDNGQMPESGQLPDGMQMPESGELPDDIQMPEDGQLPDGMQMPENGELPDDIQMPDGTAFSGNMGGGFGSSGGGADLTYTDDDLDSYSTIWDGEVFDTNDNDHERVMTALKNITEGTDLETYANIEDLLKYWAVHTFVVNLDSLSANMTHNYYLYEQDGQLSLVPWDYNLAFGGFQSGDASSAVNFPIDTPFSSGISEDERPIFYKLMEVEEYQELYHSYLNQLVEEYVLSGHFEQTYTMIQNLITEKVASDPTAFYTYEEFTTGSSTLKNFIYLRAESIRGQLSGSIPSTTSGQSENPNALVDASSITLSDMGTQGGGMGGGMDNTFNSTDNNTDADGQTNSQGNQGGPSGNMRGGMNGGTNTDGSTDSNFPNNFTPPDMSGDTQGDMPTMPDGTDTNGNTDANSDTTTDGNTSANNANSGFPQMGADMFGQSSTGNGTSTTTDYTTLILLGSCLILMLLATGAAKLYKKRKLM